MADTTDDECMPGLLTDENTDDYSTSDDESEDNRSESDLETPDLVGGDKPDGQAAQGSQFATGISKGFLNKGKSGKQQAQQQPNAKPSAQAGGEQPNLDALRANGDWGKGKAYASYLSEDAKAAAAATAQNGDGNLKSPDAGSQPTNDAGDEEQPELEEYLDKSYARSLRNAYEVQPAGSTPYTAQYTAPKRNKKQPQDYRQQEYTGGRAEFVGVQFQMEENRKRQELRQQMGLVDDEKDENGETRVGRCSLRPDTFDLSDIPACKDGRIVLESDKRVSLTCSAGCNVMFHHNCYKKVKPHVQHLISVGKQAKQFAACPTPSCEGKLLKVVITQGPKDKPAYNYSEYTDNALQKQIEDRKAAAKQKALEQLQKPVRVPSIKQKRGKHADAAAAADADGSNRSPQQALDTDGNNINSAVIDSKAAKELLDDDFAVPMIMQDSSNTTPSKKKFGKAGGHKVGGEHAQGAKPDIVDLDILEANIILKPKADDSDDDPFAIGKPRLRNKAAMTKAVQAAINQGAAVPAGKGKQKKKKRGAQKMDLLEFVGADRRALDAQYSQDAGEYLDEPVAETKQPVAVSLSDFPELGAAAAKPNAASQNGTIPNTQLQHFAAAMRQYLESLKKPTDSEVSKVMLVEKLNCKQMRDQCSGTASMAAFFKDYIIQITKLVPLDVQVYAAAEAAAVRFLDESIAYTAYTALRTKSFLGRRIDIVFLTDFPSNDLVQEFLAEAQARSEAQEAAAAIKQDKRSTRPLKKLDANAPSFVPAFGSRAPAAAPSPTLQTATTIESASSIEAATNALSRVVGEIGLAAHADVTNEQDVRKRLERFRGVEVLRCNDQLEDVYKQLEHFALQQRFFSDWIKVFAGDDTAMLLYNKDKNRLVGPFECFRSPRDEHEGNAPVRRFTTKRNRSLPQLITLERDVWSRVVNIDAQQLPQRLEGEDCQKLLSLFEAQLIVKMEHIPFPPLSDSDSEIDDDSSAGLPTKSSGSTTTTSAATGNALLTATGARKPRSSNSSISGVVDATPRSAVSVQYGSSIPPSSVTDFVSEAASVSSVGATAMETPRSSVVPNDNASVCSDATSVTTRMHDWAVTADPSRSHAASRRPAAADQTAVRTAPARPPPRGPTAAVNAPLGAPAPPGFAARNAEQQDTVAKQQAAELERLRQLHADEELARKLQAEENQQVAGNATVPMFPARPPAPAAPVRPAQRPPMWQQVQPRGRVRPAPPQHGVAPPHPHPPRAAISNQAQTAAYGSHVAYNNGYGGMPAQPQYSAAAQQWPGLPGAPVAAPPRPHATQPQQAMANGNGLSSHTAAAQPRPPASENSASDFMSMFFPQEEDDE